MTDENIHKWHAFHSQSHLEMPGVLHKLVLHSSIKWLKQPPELKSTDHSQFLPALLIDVILVSNEDIK